MQDQKNPALKQMALKALPLLQSYKSSVINAIDMASMDPNIGIASMQNATSDFNILRDQLAETLTALEKETSLSIQEGEQATRSVVFTIGATLLFALISLGLISRWLA